MFPALSIIVPINFPVITRSATKARLTLDAGKDEGPEKKKGVQSAVHPMNIFC